MSYINLQSIIVNALDVPDAFSGIFASFWVFLIITIVVSLLIMVGMIIAIVFIFRTIMKRNKESQDTFEKQYAEASKEIFCEFCGRKMKYGDVECSNCGAAIKQN